ncbi:ligase-associated DNA damage response DEXH box helicase [soil metagenome]
MGGEAQVLEWFGSHDWEPFAFQREVWQAYRQGESGLIHSATGTGKTLAAWFGPMICWLDDHPDFTPAEHRNDAEPLTVLWITPLRALAADTAESLLQPVRELGIPWTVETRTGDTDSSTKGKQARRLPTALVTTPESLSLLISREDSDSLFAHLEAIVVDEWHELIGSKRGTMTELVLARVRAMCPNARVWGVSATLGNLEEAMDSLLAGAPGRMGKGFSDKLVIIDSIIPPNIRRFPWAGHFGTTMVPEVVKAIAESESTLVFTNTRAMAEIWYQQILDAEPEWAETVALHHGSLDRTERDRVEQGIKKGDLRAVVCTSSLDLGVDFSPVDRVIQVGSPKGVARLLQRAGRSGHRPGVASRVTCVPTNALELVDIASARKAAEEGRIEARAPLRKPLDVLAQHLVTVATGPGFREAEMLAEVRTTLAYRDLSDEEWGWSMAFVTQGGASLRAYPEYRRVALGEDGTYRVADPHIAKRHRMSIGTITSDAAMTVRYQGGGVIGTVEENFLARLRPGDRFVFGGRALEFIRIKDMTAWVRRSREREGAIPRWNGGRLPLTGELSRAIREELDLAKYGELDSPEMRAVAAVLETQAKWSNLPGIDELLIECLQDREGQHLFFYPFEGRLVHEGLAALFAFRITRRQPLTFSLACNDYGFELLSATPFDVEEALEGDLFSTGNLVEEIYASLNEVEMAKRQFREIARVAGLIFPGFPGTNKSAKQLQSSSGLFYDVFSRYDPENMLLKQAHREVLERQFEESRLADALRRMGKSRLVVTTPKRPTPFAFPILVDRLRETLTSEGMAQRIERLADELEVVAGPATIR